MDSLVKVIEKHLQVRILVVVQHLFPKKVISLLDINECELDIDNCDQQATCTNNHGSYSCACNNGWTGNGTSCEGM